MWHRGIRVLQRQRERHPKRVTIAYGAVFLGVLAPFLNSYGTLLWDSGIAGRVVLALTIAILVLLQMVLSIWIMVSRLMRRR
jgi:hypothetical protein